MIIILVMVIVGIYAAWTYPRVVLNLPVAFSLGVTVESEQFGIPFLDSQVQVQVTVDSGASIWIARILKDSQILWNYTAPQVGQTTYDSGWMALSSGSYNLTFAIAGGSLSALVKVNSKGGFW